MGLWILHKRIFTGSNTYGDPDVSYQDFQIDAEIQPVRETDVQISPGYDLRHYKHIFMPALQTGTNSVDPDHLDIIEYMGNKYLIVFIQDFTVGNISVYRRGLLRQMIGENVDQ